MGHRPPYRLTWHWVDLCAEHPEKVDLFLRLGVGHVDDTLVSLGPANVGETDTGVASCSLDDGSSRSDEACQRSRER